MRNLRTIVALVALTLSPFTLVGCVSGSGGAKTVTVEHEVPAGEPLRWNHDVTSAQAACANQGHRAPAHERTCGGTSAAAAQAQPSVGPEYRDGAFRTDALYPLSDRQVNAGFNGLVVNELARTNALHQAQSTTAVRREQLNQLDQVRGMNSGSGANPGGSQSGPAARQASNPNGQ